MIDIVDFHSHILPGMDDGARDEIESLEMLQESYFQGVRGICATAHFYAFEESPKAFLKRREDSVRRLIAALEKHPIQRPNIAVGAEVRYFFGMSEAAELSELTFGRTRYLLIEPPMERWSDYMLDEIELIGRKLKCVPVIAHVDRYMVYNDDYKMLNRLCDREILTQANNSFFLRRSTYDIACRMLKEKKIHFLGSDCHNCDNRPQNSAAVAEVLEEKFLPSYEELQIRANISIF